jgi:hypothetical protein
MNICATHFLYYGIRFFDPTYFFLNGVQPCFLSLLALESLGATI